MLIVLAVLVVCTTAAVVGAQAMVQRRAGVLLDRRYEIASDLAGAAEDPIRVWLGTPCVLPPDAESPGSTVLEDRWIAGSETVHLTVTAWDQRGMIDCRAVWAGHPLAGTLRPDIVESVRAIDGRARSHPGLDQLEGGLRRFPEPSGQSVVFTRELAAGATLATVSAEAGDTVVLNVNTTPRDLLDRAFRLAGQGGLGQILENRARGVATPSGGAPGTPGPGSRVRFVSDSDAWAVRIDARVGTLHLAWWETWQRRGGRWDRVQRLLIDE